MSIAVGGRQWKLIQEVGHLPLLPWNLALLEWKLPLLLPVALPPTSIFA